MKSRDDKHTMTTAEDASNEAFRRSMRRRFRFLAGGLVALTLVLGVAPVAANHLIVRSSDIVDGAVQTQDLKDNAVKSTKINNGAVQTPDINDRAVGNAKLKDDAVDTRNVRNRSIGDLKIKRTTPGIAVAGVAAGGTGFIANWFNRYGGQPTVDRPDTGVYVVTFPGLDGQLGNEAIVIATLFDGPGMVSHSLSVSADSIVISTFNTNGVAADRDFNMTVMTPRSAGIFAADDGESRGVRD